MKLRIFSIILFILVPLLSSCGSSVDFETIKQDDCISAVEYLYHQYKTFHTRYEDSYITEQFNEFWDVYISSTEATPNIDFDNEFVVFVTSECPKEGYSITITKVRVDMKGGAWINSGFNLSVYYRRDTPESEEGLPISTTYPYHLIQVHKSDLPFYIPTRRMYDSPRYIEVIQ